ncbi:hydroxyisourate hydrolase [Terriglobus albidus]|uniref:hydroxyisourate hydrolase n=1 Tax=Terriglobus albidus TaxID=1592106 RepID=UPI0021DF6453|nr:hydroxyisourate hydrolase [Terriglobus albidus]
MSISTHILDTSAGRPAIHVAVSLLRFENNTWKPLSDACTDNDGRVRALLPPETQLTAGLYRVTFSTGEYFAARGQQTLYPVIEITFEVRPGEQHYHIPLLLAANGFTTYRGT